MVADSYLHSGCHSKHVGMDLFPNVSVLMDLFPNASVLMDLITLGMCVPIGLDVKVIDVPMGLDANVGSAW